MCGLERVDPLTHSFQMQIIVDTLTHPAVIALLEEHLDDMRQWSPAESVHALDVSRLRKPGITFFTAWERAELLGCGALRELDAAHGEIKSMRTPNSARRRGAGRAILMHIIETARERGYSRLSLETGSVDGFVPAQRLYESAGFVRADAFGDYKPDNFAVFMTRVLP